MVNSSDTNRGAPHIRAQEDGEKQFVLHPENDDLFIQTGKQIIEACRLNISVKVWLDEFREMITFVRAWAGTRNEQIRACLAAPRGGKIVLFFVPVSNRFNFDLAEELADLNRDIVQTFNIGMVEVYQIPWEEIDRFIQVDTARPVFGEQRTTHSTMET